MPGAKIDPELIKQLDAAATGQKPVAAIFTLKVDAGQKFLPPGEVEAIVERVVKRAEEQAGASPVRVNVYKNMGAFMVSAPPPFVQALLDQDEISTAAAKPDPGDVLIRPVYSRPVDAPRPGPRKRK